MRSIPPSPSRVLVSLAALAAAACTVTSEWESGWELRTPGFLVPDTGRARAVAAGGRNTCVLTRDNRVFCQGSPEAGLLGQHPDSACGGRGCEASALRPISIVGRARYVAVGRRHACVLTWERDVYCWGSNQYGQLGVEEVPETCAFEDFWEEDPRDVYRVQCSPSPVEVPEVVGADAIAAGADHTCVLHLGDGVRCWGHEDALDSGRGHGFVPRWVRGISRLRTLVAGTRISCGGTLEGAIRCWGRGSWGLEGSFTLLAAGGEHVCGVTTGARVECPTDAPDRGGPTFKEDPRSTRSRDALADRSYEGPEAYAALVAGTEHLCGLDPDGEAFCWGQNGRGQLGVGDVEAAVRPLPVARGARTTDERYVSISAGEGHTCAVSDLHRLYCWGDNRFGQVEPGRPVRAPPVRVRIPEGG